MCTIICEKCGRAVNNIINEGCIVFAVCSQCGHNMYFCLDCGEKLYGKEEGSCAGMYCDKCGGFKVVTSNPRYFGAADHCKNSVPGNNSAMYDNLYCKIFVDTDMDYAVFFKTVKEYLNGKKEALTGIISDRCSVSVIKNKEYIRGSEDFLYWRYFLDIEPENTEENEYIRQIADLLSFLKARCNNAVAACDFEDRL